MPDRLLLPASVRDQLETLIQAGYPQEACGLLVGTFDDRGTRRVARVVPARNASPGRLHDRYLIDPEEHLKADEAARRDGVEIVGVWHSHPDASSQASETDRVHAWEGWAYLIVSVCSGRVSDMRAFCLAEGDFVEQEIVS